MNNRAENSSHACSQTHKKKHAALNICPLNRANLTAPLTAIQPLRTRGPGKAKYGSDRRSASAFLIWRQTKEIQTTDCAITTTKKNCGVQILKKNAHACLCRRESCLPPLWQNAPSFEDYLEPGLCFAG